ncbi:MAG TPA: YggT family protein [Thermoclostridium sp.]|nr:YggT family protein [Thermoclostridium sp.]HPU45425.1 YggT family protein [Thermoclostridium sp.]
MEAIILLRVICELVVVKRDSAPMRFIVQVSEPLLIPARKLLASIYRKSRIKMRMDLSPIVVMIILYLIVRLLR